ncbi:MAG: hypothetical protein CL521_02130 [Actinobacteria bacterium]|nr:hypothetical protein [Actinomycetota bacterium]
MTRSRPNRRRGRGAKPKFSHKISAHFSKRDFTCQESGQIRISLGLVGALEQIRTLAENRVNIIKGYESPEVAEKKRTLKRNLHVQGIAADITVDNVSIYDLFTVAESVPEIKGIGLNVTDNYVHVDTRKEEDRRCWVEKDGETIDLTDENRHEFFS